MRKILILNFHSTVPPQYLLLPSYTATGFQMGFRIFFGKIKYYSLLRKICLTRITSLAIISVSSLACKYLTMPLLHLLDFEKWKS